MTRECKLCGKAFKPKNGNQEYCSYKCRRIADAPKHRERCRKNYYKHREERIEKAKAYYQAHKETILKRQKKAYYQEPDFYKRMDDCCNRHGGIDNCPFDDCICN